MALLSNQIKETGRWGEAQAALYLKRKGYRILEQNYSCRFGEIDIIAADQKHLVFVEVKTRRDASFAEAREFVGAGKQRRVLSAASVWMAKHDVELEPRFDVIEIYGTSDMPYRKLVIHHFEDAFS